MGDVSVPASSARASSPEPGRIGRSGQTPDTTHEQSRSAQGDVPQDQDTPPAPTRSDPAVILSSTLTHLQSGQRFSGVVLGQTPDGRIVLDSGYGLFVVDLKASLALGPLNAQTDILLQVVTVGDDIEAAILAVNDVNLHPPQAAILTLADIRPRLIPPTLALPDPVPPDATSTGATLTTSSPASRATASGSTTAESSAPNAPEPGAAGSGDASKTQETANAVKAAITATVRPEEIIKSATVTSDAGLKTAAAQALESGAAQVAKSGALEPAETLSPIGASLTVERAGVLANKVLEPGTQLKLTVVSIAETPRRAPQQAAQPPGSGSLPSFKNFLSRPAQQMNFAAAPPVKVGLTFQATVVSRPALPGTPQSNFVQVPAAKASAAETEFLQTPLGLLRVAQGPKLPDNAVVTVQVTEVRSAPVASHPARAAFDDAGLAVTPMTRDWLALDQAVRTAGLDMTPDMQGHVYVPALASASPPAPSSTLQFFLAALRMGDIKSWFGQDGLNQLDQAGDPGLVARLSNDFASLARAVRDSGGAEWRPIILPFHDGSGIQPVAWFIRRPYDFVEGEGKGGSDSAERRNHGTRFLIELDHRSLGEMQLDGLVQAKRFDLVVRSHALLPETVRRDISDLFRKVVDGAGLDGEVLFQAGRNFPISLRADMAHRAFEAKPHPDRA